MPYVLKPNKLYARDPEHEDAFLPQNVVTDQTTQEAVAEIEEIASAAIAHVEQSVTDAQTAIAGIDAQRNSMIAAISSVAGQGTDTTLTQSGVAADAAATGFLRKSLSEQNLNNLWTLPDLYAPRASGEYIIANDGWSFSLPAGTYTISAVPVSESSDGIVRFLFKVNNENYYVNLTANGGRASKTFTLANEGTLIRIQSANTAANCPGHAASVTDVQIETGSSSTTYFPRISAADIRLRMPMVYPSGSNDWTTDSANIGAAVAASDGYCKLAPGEYHITALGFPGTSRKGIMLEGSGKSTVIVIRNDTTYSYGIRICNDCVLKDMVVRYEDTEYTPSDYYQEQNVKHGIKIAPATGTGKTHAVIENVSVENFPGAGIYIDTTGQETSDGNHILNCFVDNCSVGIMTTTDAEFNRIECCNFSGCYYGVINNGGNNVFSNCGFSGNMYGFFFNNTSGDLTNNTHGSVVGCVFNHENGDAGPVGGDGYAIYMIKATSGMQFVGCQIFYGSIYLKDCQAIAMNGFNFGKIRHNDTGVSEGVVIQIDHTNSYTYTNMLCNSIFDMAPQIIIDTTEQYADRNHFIVSNCFTRGGVEVTWPAAVE